MTMEGVGKGYGVEESTVLAVKAGADIILKPSDVPRAIDAVVKAVERGEIQHSRIQQSVRRVLELKARSGVAFQRFTSLDALRDIVGAPAHRAAAASIAQRAITLLRDRGNALPITDRRTLVVQYMPETELRAGRVFAAALRSASPDTRVVKIGPTASPGLLDSLERMALESERVVLAAYVRRIEGEGRPSIPAHIAEWMNRVAAADTANVSARVSMIAFGNPYLIRQVPSVGAYLVTFGVGDALENAAAQAVLGRAAIGGTSPVSLPGHFSRGDGLLRPALPAGTGR
jgi:beta-N-acetylhexosaminidase